MHLVPNDVVLALVPGPNTPVPVADPVGYHTGFNAVLGFCLQDIGDNRNQRKGNSLDGEDLGRALISEIFPTGIVSCKVRIWRCIFKC